MQRPRLFLCSSCGAAWEVIPRHTVRVVCESCGGVMRRDAVAVCQRAAAQARALLDDCGPGELTLTAADVAARWPAARALTVFLCCWIQARTTLAPGRVTVETFRSVAMFTAPNYAARLPNVGSDAAAAYARGYAARPNVGDLDAVAAMWALDLARVSDSSRVVVFLRGLLDSALLGPSPLEVWTVEANWRLRARTAPDALTVRPSWQAAGWSVAHGSGLVLLQLAGGPMVAVTQDDAGVVLVSDGSAEPVPLGGLADGVAGSVAALVRWLLGEQ
jgi:hypothetical protein